ncbi:MAG: MFS transporter [Actinomycetota bacterium]|nr:MFS transporter [Actinomycetota bacterium]
MTSAPPRAAPAPGTARSAFASRHFRIVWSGALAANIGSWMQNVVVSAYAFELTRSPTFVSLIVFAQLGPLLLLSIVGGVLADTVDRRRLLVGAQLEQLVASVGLAVLVFVGDPPEVALFAVVLAVGVGKALNAPAWVAVVPDLVDREDLAGAISLNSAQMNGSRVVGPALGGLLIPLVGVAGVFAIGAFGYLFSVASLLVVDIPATPRRGESSEGWRRLVAGFSVARHDPLVRRVLVTLFIFSFLCLPFVGQMPTVASENLGIRPTGLAYGLLYACFGFGALLGALSIGTVLASYSKTTIVRVGLACFAVSLAVFALLRAPAPAYPVVTVLGFCYFAAITSLNTVLQAHLHDAVRGRVMSLWLMGFGGTVPIGLLVAGPLAEATSITVVMLYGVVVAVLLAWYADLRSAKEAARRAAPGRLPGSP